MNLASIVPTDLHALRRCMEYWVAHWDFECPTLFGIELEQLQEIIGRWPSIPAGTEETTALAMIGALRELLYGASAPPKARLPVLVGLSYEQAHDLCTQVHSKLRGVNEV
jgi:hypothetical protein